MSMDHMIKLRLQLGNQGFNTDGLSDDEVSERFELKWVWQCTSCGTTPNLPGDPDASAVCQACRRSKNQPAARLGGPHHRPPDFVKREQAFRKPSHLQRKNQAGWTGCGLRLAKGIRVVEANCTCWACNHQQT